MTYSTSDIGELFGVPYIIDKNFVGFSAKSQIFARGTDLYGVHLVGVFYECDGVHFIAIPEIDGCSLSASDYIYIYIYKSIFNLFPTHYPCADSYHRERRS